MKSLQWPTRWTCLALLMLAGTLFLHAGCQGLQRPQAQLVDSPDCNSCDALFQQIQNPVLCDSSCDDASDLFTATPVTVRNWQERERWPLSLDEAVHTALQNSQVLQKLGGRVVSGPAATSTIYDPALTATNPQASSEAALAAFDAQVSSNLFINHNEQKFNNLFFGGGASSLTTDSGNYNFNLSKTTAAGTQFSVINQTNYNRNNSPVNLFRSTWDTVNTLQVRQPLLQGFGTDVNRIAGPNAIAGNYNGVLISRIREDVSLVDFETAIRDLIVDTETAYWELYFAYRNLDARIRARDFARETWENRKTRAEGGEDRLDDEAQARQQYFNFQTQVEEALSGRLQGTLGVFGAERNLRRLMGLTSNDGRLIRPTTDPSVAPILLDWDLAQQMATEDRVEIRRQKWIVKQRELEHFAACKLNRWRLDMVANYGWRGFGDNLFGSSSRPEGSAFSDLIEGELDDWQVGFEMSGAIGRRTGHLAIRNAELNLAREKALLREQQRQIMHDLNAAYAEVDRAFSAIKTNYNSRVAVLEEYQPKLLRWREGEEQIFFLLDVQQRAATQESQLDRAIVDYNLALLNFSLTSGTLLEQYNISLTEAEWDRPEEALENSLQMTAGNNLAGRDILPYTN